MMPYLPLGIGGAVTVTVLVLMLTPTECFVMQNLSATRLIVPPGSPVYPDVARIVRDSDGNVVHSTKVLSSLDEDGVIAAPRGAGGGVAPGVPSSLYEGAGAGVPPEIPLSFYEDGVIVVGEPPNSAFDALLFWAGKDWVTIPDTEDGHRSYHVECTDTVSQTIQWMFPSMFPIREYELDPPYP